MVLKNKIFFVNNIALWNFEEKTFILICEPITDYSETALFLQSLSIYRDLTKINEHFFYIEKTYSNFKIDFIIKNNFNKKWVFHYNEVIIYEFYLEEVFKYKNIEILSYLYTSNIRGYILLTQTEEGLNTFMEWELMRENRNIYIWTTRISLWNIRIPVMNVLLSLYSYTLILWKHFINKHKFMKVIIVQYKEFKEFIYKTIYLICSLIYHFFK
jgi:hypothetical protein